jgi:hypothetical protein
MDSKSTSSQPELSSRGGEVAEALADLMSELLAKGYGLTEDDFYALAEAFILDEVPELCC